MIQSSPSNNRYISGTISKKSAIFRDIFLGKIDIPANPLLRAITNSVSRDMQKEILYETSKTTVDITPTESYTIYGPLYRAATFKECITPVRMSYLLKESMCINLHTTAFKQELLIFVNIMMVSRSDYSKINQYFQEISKTLSCSSITSLLNIMQKMLDYRDGIIMLSVEQQIIIRYIFGMTMMYIDLPDTYRHTHTLRCVPDKFRDYLIDKYLFNESGKSQCASIKNIEILTDAEDLNVYRKKLIALFTEYRKQVPVVGGFLFGFISENASITKKNYKDLINELFEVTHANLDWSDTIRQLTKDNYMTLLRCHPERLATAHFISSDNLITKKDYMELILYHSERGVPRLIPMLKNNATLLPATWKGKKAKWFIVEDVLSRRPHEFKDIFTQQRNHLTNEITADLLRICIDNVPNEDLRHLPTDCLHYLYVWDNDLFMKVARKVPRYISESLNYLTKCSMYGNQPDPPKISKELMKILIDGDPTNVFEFPMDGCNVNSAYRINLYNVLCSVEGDYGGAEIFRRNIKSVIARLYEKISESGNLPAVKRRKLE